jgi:hypothetical protein
LRDNSGKPENCLVDKKRKYKVLTQQFKKTKRKSSELEE